MALHLRTHGVVEDIGLLPLVLENSGYVVDVLQTPTRLAVACYDSAHGPMTQGTTSTVQRRSSPGCARKAATWRKSILLRRRRHCNEASHIRSVCRIYQSSYCGARSRKALFRLIGFSPAGGGARLARYASIRFSHRFLHTHTQSAGSCHRCL